MKVNVCSISCRPSSRPGSRCECISTEINERSGVVFLEPNNENMDEIKESLLVHQFIRLLVHSQLTNYPIPN